MLHNWELDRPERAATSERQIVVNARGLMLGCALLIAAAFAYFVFPWPAIRRARQVRNCADMQTYAALVDHYFETHKSYPHTLRAAVEEMRGPSSSAYLLLRDGYGTPVFYASRGNEFVLVSYGSDRKPEANSYWSYRSREPEPSGRRASACNSGGDVVFTARGCFRCCGK